MTFSGTTALVVVGLGNPGESYAPTRHNAGFWWLDALAARLNLSWNLSKEHQAHTARHGQIYLVKPLTFMNLSGQAVGSLVRYYRLDKAMVVVAHDELDLAAGVVKLKHGGGHAGHNGLKSLIAHLGTPAFWRLRLGIGHPGNRDDVLAHVLSKPSVSDRLLIDEAIANSLMLWPRIEQGDLLGAQQQLHTSNPA